MNTSLEEAAMEAANAPRPWSAPVTVGPLSKPLSRTGSPVPSASSKGTSTSQAGNESTRMTNERTTDTTATKDAVEALYQYYYRRAAPTDRNVRDERPLLASLFSHDQRLPSSLQVLKEMAKQKQVHIPTQHGVINVEPMDGAEQKLPKSRPIHVSASQSPAEIISSLSDTDIKREEARSLALRAVLLQRKVEEEQRREKELAENDRYEDSLSNLSSQHPYGASTWGVTTTRASSVEANEGDNSFLFHLSGKYASAAERMRDKQQQHQLPTASATMPERSTTSAPIPISKRVTDVSLPSRTTIANHAVAAALTLQQEARRYLTTGRHQRLLALVHFAKVLLEELAQKPVKSSSASTQHSSDEPALSEVLSSLACSDNNKTGRQVISSPSSSEISQQLLVVPFLIRCACEYEDLLHIDHIATSNANNDIYASLAADPEIGADKALRYLRLSFKLVESVNTAENVSTTNAALIRYPLKTSLLPRSEVIALAKAEAIRITQSEANEVEGDEQQAQQFVIDPKITDAKVLLEKFLSSQRSGGTHSLLPTALTLIQIHLDRAVSNADSHPFIALLVKELHLTGKNNNNGASNGNYPQNDENTSLKRRSQEPNNGIPFDPKLRMMQKRLTRRPADSDEEEDIANLHQLIGISKEVAALEKESDDEPDNNADDHDANIAAPQERANVVKAMPEDELMTHVKSEMDKNYMMPDDTSSVLDGGMNDRQKAILARMFHQPLMRLPNTNTRKPNENQRTQDSTNIDNTAQTKIAASSKENIAHEVNKECVICELDAVGVQACTVCRRWFHSECGVGGSDGSQRMCSKRCNSIAQQSPDQKMTK